jgi:LysM repeat protein
MRPIQKDVRGGAAKPRASTVGDDIGEELERPMDAGGANSDSGSGVRPVVRNDPPADPAPGPRASVPKANAGWPKEVTVLNNDSLWRIAERTYGRDHADRMVPVLRQFNGLKTDLLQLDQKLKLPAPPETAGPRGERPAAAGGGSGAAARAAKVPLPARAGVRLPWEPGPAAYGDGAGTSAEGWYVVKQNESLSQIAKAQCGSVKFVGDIIKLNGIGNPDRIMAGTRLKMPARKKP